MVIKFRILNLKLIIRGLADNAGLYSDTHTGIFVPWLFLILCNRAKTNVGITGQVIRGIPH